jgi:hypothetical protein
MVYRPPQRTKPWTAGNAQRGMCGCTPWTLAHAALIAVILAGMEITSLGWCYRPRYLKIQRLNYLWTIRHSSARIAGNLIT